MDLVIATCFETIHYEGQCKRKMDHCNEILEQTIHKNHIACSWVGF
jgi:hypothetical protein